MFIRRDSDVIILRGIETMSGTFVTVETKVMCHYQHWCRQDIKAQGFILEVFLFQLNGLHPLAASKCHSLYHPSTNKYEREKRRAYYQRIREVEYGSFIFLCFFSATNTGGMTMGRERDMEVTY